jgi:hypothetical protein
MDRMQEIKSSIWEKLCRRLASLDMTEKGNTERFDRVLALWIDLQRAIHLHGGSWTAKESCAPWNSGNRQIQDAWMALTSSENAPALESLFYQMPEGPQMELARHALEVSRQRNAMPNEHQPHL